VANTLSHPYIPAKAGNQCPGSIQTRHMGYWVPAFAGMIGLVLMGCSAKESKELMSKPLLTEGLIQCSFDAYGEEGIKALEPLSLKLNASDNSFEILNDPFDRDTEALKYQANELALILEYNYHEMMEPYPHECQYKINRVDGSGVHACMLAETDTYQLHYPNKIQCKHILETKF